MDTSEEENIRKTLDLFIDGMNLLDYEKISEAFYADGLSIGIKKDQISHVLRDHWKEMGDQARAEGKDFSNDTAHYEIKSLQIVGNAASVIVDITFKTQNNVAERYIDFLHMLKVGEKWVVVNKIHPSTLT